MIKLYTQFGELIVCNKAEFLGMVPHETVGPKVDLPYITGLNEEIGSFNMINKKLDINSLDYASFNISNYNYHPSIKASMIP